jgi:PDZ-binding kinase
MIRCIAEALDYLHTEKQLMHGDLKSANVLITGEFSGVKLCDFGVTLPVNCEGKASDPNAHYIGTEAWSPLEASPP